MGVKAAAAAAWLLPGSKAQTVSWARVDAGLYRRGTPFIAQPGATLKTKPLPPHTRRKVTWDLLLVLPNLDPPDSAPSSSTPKKTTSQDGEKDTKKREGSGSGPVGLARRLAACLKAGARGVGATEGENEEEEARCAQRAIISALQRSGLTVKTVKSSDGSELYVKLAADRQLLMDFAGKCSDTYDSTDSKEVVIYFLHHDRAQCLC
eukprot:jgi/Chlat1/5221/Chrsp33S05048